MLENCFQNPFRREKQTDDEKQGNKNLRYQSLLNCNQLSPNIEFGMRFYTLLIVLAKIAISLADQICVSEEYVANCFVAKLELDQLKLQLKESGMTLHLRNKIEIVLSLFATL